MMMICEFCWRKIFSDFGNFLFSIWQRFVRSLSFGLSKYSQWISKRTLSLHMICASLSLIRDHHTGIRPFCWRTAQRPSLAMNLMVKLCESNIASQTLGSINRTAFDGKPMEFIVWTCGGSVYLCSSSFWHFDSLIRLSLFVRRLEAPESH